MDLEKMVDSQEASGLPQNARQILRYLGLEDLLVLRNVSKNIRSFLDADEQKRIWKSKMDDLREKYLEKLKLAPKKHSLLKNWITVVQNIEFSGSIQDMIICNVLKGPEELITAFCNEKNLYEITNSYGSLYDWVVVDEKLDEFTNTNIKPDLYPTLSGSYLDVMKVMLEIVTKSYNVEVIAYFGEKLMNYGKTHDFKKFDVEFKRFLDTNSNSRT